jgi:hypothetical protein
MKNIFAITSFILCFPFLIDGQTILNEEQFLEFKKIPQEKTYLYCNSTTLFSGDYLYYNLYNFKSTSKTLSDISKVAYVELINSNKEAIFKHKIQLQSGIGKGDFYISSSIPSGNYKLIAYTRWMRNFGKNNYFQTDVIIINPFQTNLSFVDTVKTQKLSQKIINTTQKKQNKYIDIHVNKKQLSSRERVELNIKAIQETRSFGNYSISVKRIDSIVAPIKPNSVIFKSNYMFNFEPHNNKNLVYLPEMRGELISGSIIEKITNKIAAFKPISFAVPGKNPIFKTSITNELGKFYFNLHEFVSNDNATLRIMDEDHDNYIIKLHKDPIIDYSNLKFSTFRITSDLKPIIRERSINNQIENAYSDLKKNSILSNDSILPFYDGFDINYVLDDFTRFKSVKETVIEIVKELKVQKVKGEYKLLLKSYEFSEKALLGLIIVDGNVIINHDDILNYDCRKIKSISVTNTKYKYGGRTYEGIIAITTSDNNFAENITHTGDKTIPITKSFYNKKYYSPEYDKNELQRIPDYRTQLFWKSNFILNKEKQTFSFYTSDYKGNYEINIDGFTKEGNPVSIKEIITVK